MADILSKTRRSFGEGGTDSTSPDHALAVRNFLLWGRKRLSFIAGAYSGSCRYCCKTRRGAAGEQKTGNNRIGTNELLNQHCALAPDLESILLAQALKIVLQQYLPSPDIGRLIMLEDGSESAACQKRPGRRLLASVYPSRILVFTLIPGHLGNVGLVC